MVHNKFRSKHLVCYEVAHKVLFHVELGFTNIVKMKMDSSVKAFINDTDITIYITALFFIKE